MKWGWEMIEYKPFPPQADDNWSHIVTLSHLSLHFRCICQVPVRVYFPCCSSEKWEGGGYVPNPILARVFIWLCSVYLSYFLNCICLISHCIYHICQLPVRAYFICCSSEKSGRMEGVCRIQYYWEYFFNYIPWNFFYFVNLFLWFVTVFVNIKSEYISPAAVVRKVGGWSVCAESDTIGNPEKWPDH